MSRISAWIHGLGKEGRTGEPTGPPLKAWQKCLTEIFGTGLGTGYVPRGHGTAASALLVLLWVWFVPRNARAEWTAVLALHLAGKPLCDWGERMWGHDPGRITIDEFAGQAVALVGVPRKPLPLLLAFVLFRYFDVFKHLTVRNYIESIPRGWGTLLDDTVAGFLARAVTGGINPLLGFRKRV
ncbi:phosphatidylglycerophosphatase A [bacterium]|nr:phosphatidylglycerophosphatase A [bacterium]